MIPESEEKGMKFDILKTVTGNGSAARVGRLVLANPQRQPVDTPNFIAVTSRGVVPHLTPDTIVKHVGNVPGVYMAMEDLVEKSQKNITKIPAVARMPAPDGKRLHAFTALPPQGLTFFGPRRNPAVKSPNGNTDIGLNVFTSNGFQSLSNTDYLAALPILQPDIALLLADIDYTASPTRTSPKSIHRMCKRTEDWLAAALKPPSQPQTTTTTALFAPTLPLPLATQSIHLDQLNELRDALSGLALYDTSLLPDLTEHYPSLTPLPRLSLDNPATPHDILRHIALGADLLLLPMINAASDAGIALTFTFPPPPSSQGSNDNDDNEDGHLLPLGIDLSDPTNASSLQPLHESCTCYTCTAHHRAYIHHLLDAREMLAWTLLQIHNHHMLASFFAAVRAALVAAVDAQQHFGETCDAFHARYAPALPVGGGTRPRVRGYHYKSAGPNEERRNKVTWHFTQAARPATVVDGVVVDSGEKT